MRFFIRIKISGGDYMKKRILALLLVIAMAVLMLSACGNKEQETTTTETTVSWETRIKQKVTEDDLPEGKVLLSTLSNEELSNFITEHGVTIPEECADMDFKKLITRMENDINGLFGYDRSYRTSYDELEAEIHGIVKEYYGY